MLLGFKLTLAVSSWAAVRYAGLAARPDLRAPRGAPPYHGFVGPSVLAIQPGAEGPGFRLVSAWTEQATMAKVRGTQRYCYDVHGLGLLTDREALLGAVPAALAEGYELQDALRRAVTRGGEGCEVVALAFLTEVGWDVAWQAGG